MKSKKKLKLIKKNIKNLTKAGEMSERDADKMREAAKKLYKDGVKLSQKNILKELTKDSNDISNVDWNTINQVDDFFHIKGPFLWMKILFGIIVGRFFLVIAFALDGHSELWVDVLINLPLVYGLIERKKWAYYLLLFQLMITNLYALTFPEPLITSILWLIIVTIPNFIYFSRRKRFFNIKS